MIHRDRLRTSSSTSAGFGVVELMVIVGIITLAIAMLLPSLCRSRETANRVKCASNLRALGQAMLLYQNDNKGAVPRTEFIDGALPTWGTAAPVPNDVSAALFLLLKTQDITPEVFTCPSSNAEKWDFGGGGNTALNWSNWTDVNRNLSYCYQNPYSKPHPDDPRVRWAGAVDPDFAVMADINPGVGGGYSDLLGVTTTSSARDMKRANSRNHDEDGQNVLYFDGHVSFEQNPFVGVKRDNIYTARSGTVIAPPSDLDDTILLPAAQ
jgi:prepilin-type processing-associated H-X9-DG protein